MTRIVKEQEYAVKRNEILDAARRLIYTKGFQQMSIQDLLDELKISKGAFYHYFKSKHALLEALVERTVEEELQLLLPIFQDPSLTAVEKIRRYFNTAAIWKTAQKDYLLALLQTWYADDNLIVRQKMFAGAMDRFVPWFIPVIEQGIQEGDFHPAYPLQVSEVMIALMQSLGDSMAGKILANYPHSVDGQEMVNTMHAYTDALERVLGARSGSLTFMDDEMMMQWAASREESPVEAAEPRPEPNGRPGRI